MALAAGRFGGARGGGGARSVVVRSDGEVFGFGLDAEGKTRLPKREGRRFVGASAGAQHTVLIRDDGECVAFGDNTHGQCSIPVSLRALSVAAGWHHTVVITKDGAVAFGRNE